MSLRKYLNKNKIGGLILIIVIIIAFGFGGFGGGFLSNNQNNIVKIKKCLTQWCLIQYQKNEGWIKKENIWGVDKNETFNLSFFQTFYDYFFKSINLINSKISNNIKKS